MTEPYRPLHTYEDDLPTFRAHDIPELGDRVKVLAGSHRGSTGVYYANRYNGFTKCFVVRLEGSAVEVYLGDRETEMRKV